MSQCVMCGAQISQGILCEKCDRPRTRKPAAPAQPAASKPAPPPEAPKAPPAASPATAPPAAAAGVKQAVLATKPAAEPFPKAPIVPFPVESTSFAPSSICDVLTAAKLPALLIGSDRAVKYCSGEAHVLLSLELSSRPSIDVLEKQLGFTVPPLSVPFTKDVSIGSHKVAFSVVPLSGGTGGAVLILRPTDPAVAMQSAFVNYAQETIVHPLRALREALTTAAKNRKQDPLLTDAAGTIEQILTAFELAPGVEETESLTATSAPKVDDVVRRVGDRFTPVAARKGVLLQLDAQEGDETFRNHHELEEVLVLLMENSLHYTPEGGQIVLGLRSLEHKGKPLLLFFVMDSGAHVPEHLREVIFGAGFNPDARSDERSGRGLARCKDFATQHGGSVWVESKTGKACTFFMRVRPDG
ncbi:MAG: sensor histidine kinase [Acidobacteria bacterium]|nr:sensor histidine kinase [Acidobacteriota bacterium]